MLAMTAEAKAIWKTILVSVVMVFSSLFVTRSTAFGADPPSEAIDPAFAPGLVAFRKTISVTDSASAQQTSEKPDLRLLIGVKAVEGIKRDVYFVELTSMRQAGQNSVGGSSSPIWHTNRINWPGSQPASHTNKTFEFVYRLVPLRVRVFDDMDRLLKQGQALVPWELMTNSLAEVCRLCIGLQEIQAMPSKDQKARKEALEELLSGGTTTGSVDTARVMRPIAGGILTLGGLLAECVSTPALNDICDKAQCVVRLPGAWTMLSTALGAKLNLALDPRFLTDVAQVRVGKEGEAEPLYWFPADLMNGKRKLVSVEFIVGSSTAAEVMLAGIRSIRAVHPTKPDRQFVAQVLAAGIASEEPSTVDSAK
jgi:hypothetical protein